MSTNQDKYACPHNDGVHCMPGYRFCEKCGWNPPVSEARLQRFCEQNGIVYPEENPEKEEI